MAIREQLIKMIHAAKDRNKAPGVIFAISEKGQINYSETLGYRDVEAKKEVTEDTVFGIASITKSFTSVALMHLQENGKLSVHDPVIKYLPEFTVGENQSVSEITIHHFMTHSSGLPPMDALEYSFKRRTKEDPDPKHHVGENESIELIDTYEQLMAYIEQKEVDLLGEPGEYFSYSNEAYSLLGAIIERVSGMSYKEYVYKYVIRPCGLKNTRFQMEEYEDYNNITKPYKEIDREDGQYIVADDYWADSNSMRATGLLKSTAKDLLTYAEIFRNNGNVNEVQVINKESVAEMIKPHIKVHFGEYYGYGLRVVPDYFGDTLIGHGGSLRSVSSGFGVVMEKGISGVVLANIMGFPASRSVDKLFNDFSNRDVDEFLPYEVYEVSLETMLSYIGTYESDEGAQIELRVENEQLLFENKDGIYKTMFIDDTAFIIENEDSRSVVEVYIDEAKQPYGLAYGSRFVHKVD